jgi:hypothetical protein
LKSYIIDSGTNGGTNMLSIKLTFEGYYTEEELNSYDSSSREPGIYAVYAGVSNDFGEVNPKRLLYIGESMNVIKRLTNKHEKKIAWIAELKDNEELRFSFTKEINNEFSPTIKKKFVDAEKRIRDKFKQDNVKMIEAALIYYYKPPCNEKNVHSMEYTNYVLEHLGIIIRTDGNNYLLESEFSILKRR